MPAIRPTRALLCVAFVTLLFPTLANAKSLTSTSGLHSTGAGHSAGMFGIASIYSGGRTANGERALPHRLTAAHRTLPFGTLVKVTHRKSGKSVVVRINDRGPFKKGRVIDLTPAAARVLGFDGFEGLAPVSLTLAAKQ